MAITRDTDVDDDGTGLTGTVRNTAWKNQIYTRIDELIADKANVTFAAGNFTGSGAPAMTWTLTSPDQVTFSYQIHNKKMKVWFSLESTSVGGTLSTDLRIAIPASKTCPIQVNGVFTYTDNGTFGVGQIQINAGGTVIRLLKPSFANWTASTNNTSAWGEIEFPIN